VNTKRMNKIQNFLDRTDDFSDGVFWAMAEEEGIDSEDLHEHGRLTKTIICSCEQCKKDGNKQVRKLPK